MGALEFGGRATDTGVLEKTAPLLRSGYYEGIVVGFGLVLGDFGEEPRKCILLWIRCCQKVRIIL